MTTVHVLGNGPTIRHFESDLFHKEPTEGIRVSCNLGQHDIPCDWTYLNSQRLFAICEQKVHFTIPVVIDRSSLYEIKGFTCNPQHLKTLTYKQVVDMREKSLDTPSAGHCAAYYAITLHSPNSVHLWGLDWLWTEDWCGIDDWQARRKSRNHHTWVGAWIKLFEHFPSTQFLIHTPDPVNSKLSTNLANVQNVRL